MTDAVVIQGRRCLGLSLTHAVIGIVGCIRVNNARGAGSRRGLKRRLVFTHVRVSMLEQGAFCFKLLQKHLLEWCRHLFPKVIKRVLVLRPFCIIPYRCFRAVDRSVCVDTSPRDGQRNQQRKWQTKHLIGERVDEEDASRLEKVRTPVSSYVGWSTAGPCRIAL